MKAALLFARAHAHVRALMTRKSCAVGMRNAILRNYLKCCNLHDLIHIFLDNGVMTTSKRRILSFVFTVLCFKESLLIRISKLYIK